VFEVGVRPSLVLLFALVPATALADDPFAPCVEAYESAQYLRREAQLMRAAETLRVCARESCPAVARKDCLEWLGEVETLLPTVVVEAKGPNGAELTDVRVFVDGSLSSDRLDGRAIPIDPGHHVLRYETTGAPAIEDEVTIRAGEKNRRLSVAFERESAPPPLPAVAPPPPTPELPPTAATVAPRPSAGPPLASIVLGGAAVVGLASFGYFGLSSVSRRSELEASCAPSCDPAQVNAVRNKQIAADASLGVAIVAIAIGAWIWIESTEDVP
jgi:hypothetical protein